MKNGILFERTVGSAVTGEQMDWLRARTRLSNGVFISHKQEDGDEACKVAREIMVKAGVSCYVDELDPTVESDSPELVTYIQEVIHRCRSLLAVVSHRTQASWWVPLEIGVALEQRNFIGSYMLDIARLPSYLWTWPVMKNTDEAVEWAKATRRSQDAEGLHRSWRRQNPQESGDLTVIYRSL